MTYSLRIVGGKLQAAGSDLKTVSGKDKLIQDLDCWFKEKYRVDRFHPSYGSVMDSHIGGTVDEETEFLIRTEAIRVITNYQQLQIKKFQENPEMFTRDELIGEIVSVEAYAFYDRIYVEVKISTVDGSLVVFGSESIA